MVLVDKSTVSDVYYYEFAIPGFQLSLFLTPSLLSDRQRRFAEHKTRCKRELGAFCERTGCELPGLSHRAFGTSRQTRRAPLDRASSPNGRGIFDLLLGSRGSSRRFPSLSEW